MESVKPGQMKAVALALAERGWPVFPLAVHGKEPVTTHGHLDATTDREQIERWWRDSALRNVGVSTGPADLLVIDVDMNEAKAKAGAATWARLIAEHGHTPTFSVRTWSGGIHYYYRMPSGERLGNSASRLGPDVDTRGDGGFVVAAGSQVREGTVAGVYAVLDDLPIADLPQWIIEALRKPERISRAGAAPAAVAADVLARMDALCAQLRDAPVGTGNDVAASVAFMAGQYAGAGQIAPDHAIALLLDAVAGWKWHAPRDADRMTNTIERQVDAGAASPRAWEAPFRAVLTPQPPGTALPVQEEAEDDPQSPEGTESAVKPVSNWGTDSGQGVFLHEKLPDLLYGDGAGWFEWDRKRFATVSENHVAMRINTFYLAQFRAALERYKTTLKEDHNETAKAYKAFMSASRLTAIVKQMSRTEGVRVDPDALDAWPDLLNTPKGIVHLPTGKVGAHDRKFLMTKITSGSYRPGFTHPDWERALEALPLDVARFMQVRMGQAAFGAMPNSHDAIVMTGTGGNGKSLWTTDGGVIALGDYAYFPKADIISPAKRTPGAADEDRAGLRGVRLALVEEVPEGRSLSTTAIKNLVGTSKITARYLHGHNMTFPATHSLFLTTNFKLAVSETDEGSWRRLCRVKFPYSYMANPKAEDDRKGDSMLPQRMRENETGQHDAILTWIIEGAQRYHADPSLINEEHRPQAVADATLSWRKESDRLLSFFEDRLVPDRSMAVVKADLYTEFLRWLASGGHEKWTQETFFSRLTGHKAFRAAMVTTSQVTLSSVAISRPEVVNQPGATWNSSSALPPLPIRARIFRGIRFAIDGES